MELKVERSSIITALCTHLRTNVTDLKLVKPYHGELDRYSKKTQLQEETFPAMVNLTTPFALVISKDRRRVENRGQSLRFRHDISIYIGESNLHDFNNTEVPTIFTLMSKCLKSLHGVSLVSGAGALNIESEGEYLLTTDLFTLYDQKYYLYEIGT